MKKAITILLSAIVLLFASCPSENPDPGAQPIEDADLIVTAAEIDSTVSRTYHVSGSDIVKLTGLEDGALYGIYPSAKASARSIAARDIAPPEIIPTEGNTYLHLSDGRTLAFQPWDMGIEDSGELRFIRYTPTEGEMKIDTESDTPLYTNESDYRVFEEYYHVQVSSLIESGLDVSNVVLLQNGIPRNAYVSREAGVLDQNGIRQNAGVMDLSDIRAIDLFNQIKIKSGSYTNELILQNPVTIDDESAEKSISAPQMLLIGPSSSDRILEVDISNNSLSDFNLATNAFLTSYANASIRKSQVAQFEYDGTGNKLKLYIPSDKNSFLLPFTVRTDNTSPIGVTLRNINDVESAEIRRISPKDGQTITVDLAENYYTLILIEGNSNDLEGLGLMANASVDCLIQIVYSNNINGQGYTSNVVNPSVTGRDGKVPEYILISNNRSGKGQVQLQFSRGAFNESLGETVEVDASQLSSNSSLEKQVKWSDTVTLSNLTVGNLYGVYIEGAAGVGNEDFVYVQEGVYITLASDTSMTFPANSLFYGTNAKLHFFAIEYTPDRASLSAPVITTSEGRVYMRAQKFDTPPAECIISCIVEDTGSGGSTNNRYFSINTGESDWVSMKTISTSGPIAVLCSRLITSDTGSVSAFDISLAQVQELKTGTNKATLPALVSIGPSEKALVLETEGRSTVTESIYSSRDVRSPYFFPFAQKEDGKYLYYVGTLTEKAIYKLQMNSGDSELVLREIAPEEDKLIKRVNLSANGQTTFDIDSSSTLVPVIFSGLEDLRREYSIQVSAEGWTCDMVFSSEDSSGYSQRGTSKLESGVTITNSRTPEYAIFSPDGEGTPSSTVTITIN